MQNVPDDWGTYWRTCAACGHRYHESEGGCDCDERRGELLVASIEKHLPRFAGELDIEPPVVEMSAGLTARLGYLSGGTVSAEQAMARAALFGGLQRAAIECIADVEVWAQDEEAGEQWTVEIITGTS